MFQVGNKRKMNERMNQKILETGEIKEHKKIFMCPVVVHVEFNRVLQKNNTLTYTYI
jgi:hypothetical protein